jgi:AcrR family transcriptional regulator
VTRRRAKGAKAARRLELLWGPGERASRGPKPALSIEQIVSSAIEIADREGLAALTMRRVADDVGFTTMALYRYVPSKDELIDLMIDAAIGPPPSPDPGGDWASELQRWARADLAILRRHPWLLELVARALQGPNWFAWFEWALRSLSATGLTPSDMVAMVGLVDGHVRATAQVFLGLAKAAQRAGTPNAWGSGFAAALERVIGDPRFPVLTHVAASGGFEKDHKDFAPSDNDFEFGLQRLLDGIEAYIRGRATPQRPRRSAPRQR